MNEGGADEAECDRSRGSERDAIDAWCSESRLRAAAAPREMTSSEAVRRVPKNLAKVGVVSMSRWRHVEEQWVS